MHQPRRLRHYDFSEIGQSRHYFDDVQNLEILNRVADKSYLPVNEMFMRLIDEHDQSFRFGLSISGSLIDQLERWRPDVLDSFRRLVDTGCCDILAETYYHSLASLFDRDEYLRQLQLHGEKVQQVFGVTTKVARNSELIYNDDIGAEMAQLGYIGMLAEGANRALAGQSPNFLYHPPGNKDFSLLLRNRSLSDDVAYRYSDRGWSEYPLSAHKYLSWFCQSSGDLANLFIDYESIGERQWVGSGIFDFWSEFITQGRRQDFRFKTPTQVISNHRPPRREYHCPEMTSLGDSEHDLSAWLGNEMQREAAEKVFQLKAAVLASGDFALACDWAYLTSSDHLFYMSTKGGADGQLHDYFSPYESPQQAHSYFMNVVHDMEKRLARVHV
ncbi:glycoside hydrolase family 57 protein [Persicirhabdus sediminis]|uniref:Glycoside hydrolase family 57 protein n=1 Tax=Persicirhabdus sediminis TaxID=454144 RepID=A0A8J7SLJ8_9BACT|nr:glycoside hydrolase family 57 protein [Persicirhabdus sediminis]MBK1790443.1 glycoside hydrolase family 57 protein [Persicirhabdus sediminis]